MASCSSDGARLLRGLYGIVSHLVTRNAPVAYGSEAANLGAMSSLRHAALPARLTSYAASWLCSSPSERVASRSISPRMTSEMDAWDCSARCSTKARCCG